MKKKRKLLNVTHLRDFLHKNLIPNKEEIKLDLGRDVIELTHNITKMLTVCSGIALNLRYCIKKGPNHTMPWQGLDISISYKIKQNKQKETRKKGRNGRREGGRERGREKRVEKERYIE